jgi:hypothetical protein
VHGRLCSELPLDRGRWASLGIVTIFCVSPPNSLSAQVTGTVALEGAGYSAQPQTTLDPLEFALSFDAALSLMTGDEEFELRAEPFLRLDPTGERSRVDMTVLSLSALYETWEMSIGFADLAWGVSESRHLVDGVNQRDLVGPGSGYLRMGQLTASLTAIRPWGTVDAMFLPWFRERRFDGRAGLLWSPLPVDPSRTSWAEGAKEWRLDWALRWNHTLGPVDIAVSHLQGNLREPGFVEIADDERASVLAPRYSLGGQTGVEFQAVTGRWIVNVEALSANPEPGRYLAVAGGVEYSVAQYLGLFLEYAWDSRGGTALTSFQDDFFLGGRLLLPDGQARAAAYVDRKQGNLVLTLEADRRLGNAFVLGIAAGAFIGDASEEPILARRQQTGSSLRLSRFF